MHVVSTPKLRMASINYKTTQTNNLATEARIRKNDVGTKPGGALPPSNCLSQDTMTPTHVYEF